MSTNGFRNFVTYTKSKISVVSDHDDTGWSHRMTPNQRDQMTGDTGSGALCHCVVTSKITAKWVHRIVQNSEAVS